MFQLTQWEMESGKIEIQPKYRVSLETEVAAECRNPNREIPFRFLMLTDIKGDRNPSTFLEENDPIPAAGILPEEPHSKLEPTVPGLVWDGVN